MTKGSIHQEDMKIVKTYPFNLGVPKYTEQTLTGLKGGTDSMIIVRGFRSHFQPWIGHPDQKLISKHWI